MGPRAAEGALQHEQRGKEVLITGSVSESAAVWRESISLIPAKPASSTGVAELADERLRTIWRRDSFYRRLLGTADAFAISIALLVAVPLFGGHALEPFAAAALPLLVLLAKVMGLYDRDQHLLHKTTLDEVPSLFSLATLSTLVLFVAGDLVSTGELSSLSVLAMWGALFAGLMILRALARSIAAALTPPERCLFVGAADHAAQFARKLATTGGVRAELVGRLGADDGHAGPIELSAMLPALEAYLATEPLDRVVLSPGSEGADDLMYAITELKSYGVKVSVLTAMSRVAGSSVELDQLNGMTLLGLRRFDISTSSRFVKRSFDVVGSSLALIVLAPVLLAIALAIKLDSRGPVLFRQPRVGHRDEVFEMLKFRSMVEDADERKDEYRHLDQGQGIFKIVNDPRVTRVGRFIRRWAIDELPQLVNVIRGEMSLVGPRPLPLDEDRKIVGWYRRRLGIAPGITGYWQATDGAHSLDEMVRLDCLYLANWSLWNDIRILLRTIPRVLRRPTL